MTVYSAVDKQVSLSDKIVPILLILISYFCDAQSNVDIDNNHMMFNH